jgi:F-type H+-transporting ATPase subunit delta
MDDVMHSGIVTSLPGRYAKVLFDLAQDHQTTETIVNDLDKLLQLIDENTELAAALNSPVVERHEQINVIKNVAEKLQIYPLLTNFLTTLLENKRYYLIKDIQQLFHKMWDDHQGRRKVIIEYATPLTKEQNQFLKDKLEQLIGHNINIVYRHNDNHLAGVVIRQDNQIIDLSLATQLANLASSMKGAA